MSQENHIWDASRSMSPWSMTGQRAFLDAFATAVEASADVKLVYAASCGADGLAMLWDASADVLVVNLELPAVQASM